jgi:putative sigma-54 modulation protein
MSVDMQVTGKHLEITKEIVDYVHRRFEKLSRHLSNIQESKIEIMREMTKSPKDRYAVQVTLNSRGTLLRGEVRAADLFEAIDNASKVMDRQIERYKGRLSDKNKAPHTSQPPQQTVVPTPLPPAGKVVKSKRFEVKPMTANEALEQMELLGHDFFLFFDENRGQINLIYRRKDGNYGLIEPELA